MLTKLLQTSLIFTIRWTESEIEGSSFTQPMSTTWVMGLIPFLSLFFPFYCTLFFFFPVFRTGSSLTETISVFSIFDFITYTLLLLPLSLSLSPQYDVCLKLLFFKCNHGRVGWKLSHFIYGSFESVMLTFIWSMWLRPCDCMCLYLSVCKRERSVLTRLYMFTWIDIHSTQTDTSIMDADFVDCGGGCIIHFFVSNRYQKTFC